MTKANFNRESFAARLGTVTGHLMGKHVQDIDGGLKALEHLAQGDVNAFLKSVPESVRVKVKQLMAPNGIPYALDPHELQEMAMKAKDKFNQSVTGKKPAASAKAAPPQAKAKGKPSLAPV